MDWLELVESLQNMMLSKAEYGGVSNSDFKSVREQILANKELAKKLPRFVRTCSDPTQFWGYITKFRNYSERREHIRKEFRPASDFLESRERSPADDTVADALAKLDIQHVTEAWEKALERRSDDAEGAITAARTLLETVCKCILDDIGAEYNKDSDLPKLYYLTAEKLNLTPNKQSEKIMKRILGSCQSVVEGIGALRNLLSDSHGKGKEPIEPEPYHAELAVNLAGSMATFLVQVWERHQSN